jgi:hypothetical protein
MRSRDQFIRELHEWIDQKQIEAVSNKDAEKYSDPKEQAVVRALHGGMIQAYGAVRLKIMKMLSEEEHIAQETDIQVP